MRIIKIRKNTGCLLEAVVFDNGKVAACWQTDVPEVAVYDSVEQFLSVRTLERGYKIEGDVDVAHYEAEIARLNDAHKVALDLLGATLEAEHAERVKAETRYTSSQEALSDLLAEHRGSEARAEKAEAELAEVKRRVLAVADDDDLGNTALAALARQIREGK